MEAVLVTPEAQKAVEETNVMVRTYDNYIIQSQETYAGAGKDLQVIKAKYKELDELRKSLTKPLDESKKRIMEFFNKPLEFLSSAETKVKQSMISYQNEQERIRRAEEARLAEIQRKAAEELQRKAREEEERANSLKTQKAKDAAQERADELKAKAAEVISIPAPIIESKVEAVSGISTKTVWKFRIVDATKIPREYLIPNEKYISEIVRVTKGTKKIDGIEIYSENVISARS